MWMWNECFYLKFNIRFNEKNKLLCFNGQSHSVKFYFVGFFFHFLLKNSLKSSDYSLMIIHN